MPGTHQRMTTDIAVAMATAIDPPAQAKSKNKRRPDTVIRRGPPRPYKKIAGDLLQSRIKRLTDRLERVKKQHDTARQQLTKYAHEQFYREQDEIQNNRPQEPAPAGPPPLDTQQIPLPPA